MLRRALLLLSALLLCSSASSIAQKQTAPARDAAIRAMMQKSADDWNRGDLDAFATSYKNSPDILFIGRTVRHGYAGMIAGYKSGYPTREKMGMLTFRELEVQPLDEKFVTATGKFHLERTATGGGNADGYFLLVIENTPDGWKIVRDDTTALPASAK